MKSRGNPFAVPLPLSWFHPRCRAPLAQRLGAVAEYSLSRCEQKPLPVKKNGTLRYVTMASRAHWLLLRESLVSLHRTWDSIPELIVASDGSWKRDEFLEAFDFWPNPIKVLMPDEILEPLAQAGQNALVELARKHPLGLKLAVIVFLARDETIFFVDSDILWFSDPVDILMSYQVLNRPAAAVETASSYNKELVQRFCPGGLPSPGINTGCVYLKGGLCDQQLWEQMLASALENPAHNFNEQTIIAIAVQKNGRKFPAKLCLVDFADATTLKRKKPWRDKFHARHYVNWMRHQFYRDAALLRRMVPS